MTLLLTTTLRHGLPGDTRQLTSSKLTLTSITGPSAIRQARRLPSGVTDSWRMLRSELRGATESGICAEGVREGVWKVRRRRQTPWLQLFLHLCHSV